MGNALDCNRLDLNGELSSEPQLHSQKAASDEASQSLRLVDQPNDEAEDIRRRQEIYQRIFDYGLEGMFQSTPDGAFLAANRALAEMYGYASEEELTASLTDIGQQLYVEPGRRQEFVRLLKEKGQISGFESHIRRRDGTELWISETARAVCDARGNPIYYEGTVQDISRRKLAEDSLRKSQHFIERVADTSPAILYVYDLLENRYLYINHQVRKILGLKVEDVVGTSADFIADRIHPEDTDIADERVRRLASAEDGQIFESRFRLRNIRGEWIWIVTRDVLFTRRNDGCPEQIIGMAQDFTARRQAHEELEKSRERLRALSTRIQQVREEERAGIAREIHDELGQTLTALSMDVSRMRSRISKLEMPADPEVAERLTSMDQHIDSMLHTVRKISAELRPPLLDECGVAVAIEWQALQFQRRYGVRCEVVNDWETAVVDQKLSTAIFRIFQEILTNVARHAKASKVLVHMRQLSDSLLLVVKDNGRGITETEKSASLGVLGMRERAHLFGGVIEIHGTPGKGTTVTVRIPVAAVVTQNGKHAFKAPPRKETLVPEEAKPFLPIPIQEP